MKRTSFSACGALAALAATLFAAPAAHAQLGILGAGGEHGTQGGLNNGKSADDYYRKPALPPALPGARATTDRVAPADKLALDMQPNDALFDAVNRGDIAAAREALGRGADIRARNILGMTPTELSVDLGHTNITFLLLSMRGAALPPGARRTPPRAAAAVAPATGGIRVATAPLTAVQTDAPGTAAPRAAAPARPAPVVAPVVARAAPVRLPVPPRQEAPRVLADDSGTPRPSVGFLGFGR